MSEKALRVVATGDMFITRRIAEDGYEGFEELSDCIKEHDVKFSNLEMTFHNQEGYPAAVSGGTWAMMEPEALDDVKRFGFNLTEGTRNNTGMTFVIAINYGGRDEIVRAARKLVEDYRANDKDVASIDESLFAGYLDTAGIPDPDLMIRTSGELRLSNYLLWQLAYAEFYVTDCLWPDFDQKELEKAIVAYNSRERRFGGRK